MENSYNEKEYINNKIKNFYKQKYATKSYYINKSIKNKHINKRENDRILGGFNKIYNNITARINSVLNMNDLRNYRDYDRILGCSYDELQNYITDKLKFGMTLDNYGAWEIDHIIPISYFNFNKYDDEFDNNISKCFHYTNLQPLWLPENRKKSNKLFYDFE